MNRRLQIDINSIQHQQEEEEEDREEGFGVEEDVDDSERSQRDGQEKSQEDDQEERDRSEASPEQVSKSGQAFESIETFGNNHDPYSRHSDFIEQLMQRPDTFRTNRPLNPINHHNLSETPISRHTPTPNSYSNRRQEIEQSNIDDQIARIISKVNQSSSKSKANNRGQMMEVEKVKKIHRINDQLLKENTQLINQISELEKKMNEINNKLSNKKKTEDSTLTKTLKKYREKLDNAMSLNSKLSNRLTSQRSRSNAISNTFRSMINKEVSSSSMVSNLLKSQLKADSAFSKNKRKKSNITEHVYCQKCCKEIQPIPKTILSREFNSKELIFSPVLQVKDYEILAANPTNQFELNRKATQRQVQVQVSFEEGIDEMETLRKEEEELQGIIERNNEKLAQYEEQLYRLVEIG